MSAVQSFMNDMTPCFITIIYVLALCPTEEKKYSIHVMVHLGYESDTHNDGGCIA